MANFYAWFVIGFGTHTFLVPSLKIGSKNKKARNWRAFLFNNKAYLFITYIVTSKPKRISVAAGVVHMIISFKVWRLIMIRFMFHIMRAYLKTTLCAWRKYA